MGQRGILSVTDCGLRNTTLPQSNLLNLDRGGGGNGVGEGGAEEGGGCGAVRVTVGTSKDTFTEVMGHCGNIKGHIH